MKLTAIAEEGDILQKFKDLRCEDLKSCYHQYAVSERTMYASGCRYKGKVLVCQTMMYGPAPCVIIADSALTLATNAISLRSNCYVRGYIDDVIQAPAFPDHTKPHLISLGLFVAQKTQAGPRVNYTGFTLDADEKTIQVHEKTRIKIKAAVETKVFSENGRENLIFFEDLEEITGMVSWAATTSPWGRTLMFSIIGDLNEGRLQSSPVVQLSPESMQELVMWASTAQKLPMGSFKVTGVKAECYSDASKDYLAAKANGKVTCGPVPAEFIDQPIVVKEALALLELGKFCLECGFSNTLKS